MHIVPIVCQLTCCFIACLDIDDCINATCRNGASCVDGLNIYTCNCVAGFTGNHCETGIDQLSILGYIIQAIKDSRAPKETHGFFSSLINFPLFFLK